MERSLFFNYIWNPKVRLVQESVPEGTHPPFIFQEVIFIENQIYRSSRNGLKKNFSKNFLARTPRAQPKILAKIFEFVVFSRSNKPKLQIFLYRLVGAHLKNFSRARAPTRRKNYLNIK